MCRCSNSHRPTLSHALPRSASGGRCRDSVGPPLPPKKPGRSSMPAPCKRAKRFFSLMASMGAVRVPGRRRFFVRKRKTKPVSGEIGAIVAPGMDINGWLLGSVATPEYGAVSKWAKMNRNELHRLPDRSTCLSLGLWVLPKAQGRSCLTETACEGGRRRSTEN